MKSTKSEKSALKKMKNPLQIKECDSIPLSYFGNDNLTILETVISYCRNKGMKYVEIAKALDRDQRNIWTIYSKTMKKNKEIFKYSKNL